MGIKSVYVIILNWNHKNDLLLTLESFIKQTYSDLKILVADNGSKDGSVELIKKDYPNIVILDNKENLGFAAGNNKAIEHALSQNADFVLLANNDIYIDNPNLVSQIMLEISNSDIKNIGIYGIQERNFYCKDKIESEGHFLFDDFSTPSKQLNTKRVEYASPQPSPIKYVDFVAGSFILVKNEVFEKCGLLDEAFFMYHEEAEFCFRAWLNGFKVVINPTYNYFHKVAKSAGTGSPFSLYYRVRNNFYFLHKHKKQIKFYSYYFRRYAISIIHSFLKLSALLIFHYKRTIELWKALLRAIIDARNHVYYKRF